MSLPTPPANESLPPPPVRVSARTEPVSLVAAPILVMLYPLIPATAARLTAKPRVVMFAVLELLYVCAVAVHAAVTVAFAVAPKATVSTSAPPWPKSVIVSAPDATMKVSIPNPPVRLSSSKPPIKMSLPAPPLRVSSPAPPVRELLPESPI